MMNTKEAIAYLKYQGPIWLKKIEFTKEEDKCGNCPPKEGKNSSTSLNKP